MGRHLSPQILVLTGVLALANVQCALFGPPGWVSSYPVSDGYIHGVGSAGVTFDSSPAHSREIARQRALDDLARQIRVHVTTSTTLVDSEASSFFQADTVQFTDEDLQGIELVEVWIDDWGRAGKAHQTYVLVRMDRDQLRSIAARSL